MQGKGTTGLFQRGSFSGSSDECFNEKVSPVPITNDDRSIIKWVIYVIISRYMAVKVAYFFDIVRTDWH